VCRHDKLPKFTAAFTADLDIAEAISSLCWFKAESPFCTLMYDNMCKAAATLKTCPSDFLSIPTYATSFFENYQL